MNPGRHFCVECETRVFPFDSYEALTEAPDPGAKGAPVLLSSYNATLRNRDPHGLRVAWCWRCNDFTDCERMERADLLVRYLRRQGVVIRTTGKGSGASQLELVLDQRRQRRA